MKIFPQLLGPSILAILSLLMCRDAYAQNTKKQIAKKENTASSLALYEKYIDVNNEAHLKELTELVSIPGISSVPSYQPDIDKTAAWILKSQIKEQKIWKYIIIQK